MENKLNLSETVQFVVDFYTATIQNGKMVMVQSHKYMEIHWTTDWTGLDWQHSDAVEERPEQPVLSEGAVRDVLLVFKAKKEDGRATEDQVHAPFSGY